MSRSLGIIKELQADIFGACNSFDTAAYMGSVQQYFFKLFFPGFPER